MDKNKQTAVEWLIRELVKSKDYQRVINDVNQIGTEVKDVIQQAIVIEKEQIIAANEDSSTNELGELFTGEQYYNETYG